MSAHPLPSPPRAPVGTRLLLVALLGLVVASFATLDIQWAALFEHDAAGKMAEFLSGFFPPDLSGAFLRKVGAGAFETLAMSLIGTVLAAAFGLLLALPASHRTAAA